MRFISTSLDPKEGRRDDGTRKSLRSRPDTAAVEPVVAAGAATSAYRSSPEPAFAESLVGLLPRLRAYGHHPYTSPEGVASGFRDPGRHHGAGRHRAVLLRTAGDIFRMPG